MARLLCLVIVVAGCDLGGESTDGDCPEGEMCSDLGPDSLFFLGSALGDQTLGRMEPLPMAVGGRQSIRVVTGESAGSPAFEMPFLAASSGPELGIAGVTPPDVTVQGLAEGQAFLRIVEPETALLHDRVELTVIAVARAEVAPRAYLDPAADMAFAQNPGSWALVAGGTEAVVARLFAAGGERLADEGLALAVVGAGLAAGTREAWDTLSVTAVGTGTGEIAVRPGDGVARDATIAIVPSVSDIMGVAAQGAGDVGEPGPVGATGRTFCFRATSGSDLVAGVSFVFSVTSGLATTSAGPQNCVQVTASIPTSGMLSVTAGGITRDFPLTFVAAKPTP